jgi:hypothetical protein
MNENINLSISDISTKLEDNLKILIEMNLKLDRCEISKALTNSLNKSITGNKIKLSDIYISITEDFDNATDNVNMIIDQINQFNKNKSYEYFIDCESIKYILFHKHIVYIRKLITNVVLYINSNINLVYIYGFIINKIYSGSFDTITDYLYILNKIITEDSIDLTNKNILSQLFNSNFIDTAKIIFEFVYNSDSLLIKLLEDYEKTKLDEYKKNNSVDESDEIKNINNEHNKNAKSIKDNKGTKNGIKINDVETEYEKKKNFLLVNKRDITIDNICTNEFLIKLFLDKKISIELWQGYNLFLYKNFNYKFDDYKKKINDFVVSNNLDALYLIELDYLNDLSIPDVGIIVNEVQLTGGKKFQNITNYKLKYYKYKSKYLNLKK